MAAMGLAQLLPALVSGVDQVAGRARYRLRHLRSRGAPRSCYAVERDAEEAPRVRPVGCRRSDRRRVPDLCLENVGDGLAGGVVHLDGVPVAVDVRDERRGRNSRQFASDKRTRLFAPPSVVAEGVLKVDRALTHASTVLVTSDRRPAAARLPSSVAPHPLMRRSTCLLTVWVLAARSRDVVRRFQRASPLLCRPGGGAPSTTGSVALRSRPLPSTRRLPRPPHATSEVRAALSTTRGALTSGAFPAGLAGECEVVPRDQGVGVVGAEDLLAVGEGLLVEQDGPVQVPSRLAGAREVAPGGQRRGVVRADDSVELSQVPPTAQIVELGDEDASPS